MDNLGLIINSQYGIAGIAGDRQKMDSYLMLIIYEQSNPYNFLTSQAEAAVESSYYWESENVKSLIKRELSIQEIQKKIMGNAKLHINKYADLDTSCFENLKYQEIHDYKSLEYPGKRSRRWR